MQFQLAPDTARLFAQATAAHIRDRADIAQTVAEYEAWRTLWLTFRNATDATLTVPDDAARLMFYVWSDPVVWRDEPTRLDVRAQLRPQWRVQMAALPASGRPRAAKAVGS